MNLSERPIQPKGQPKQKKCRMCREPFTQERKGQLVCNVECARSYARHKGSQKQRKDAQIQAKARKEGLEALKTLADWIKDAQKAVNAYCRARDIKAGHGCIDCGKPFEPQKPGGSIDAGHFLSRGSHPNLRFEELNIHAQRKNCNRPGGTTAAAFRLGMISRIGLEAVEKLEEDHEPRHYRIEDLKQIIATYKQKLRDLYT